MPIIIVPDTPRTMPIPQRHINQTIKDNVVWLVDEFRKRKGIEGHVVLEEHQFDDLVGGIVEIIEKYEGVCLHRGGEEEDDEDGAGKAA